MLLSIAKSQNLKAIHNMCRCAIAVSSVVINHKTTKFESNSQLDWYDIVAAFSCYQSQNYKIWKQFTTSIHKGKPTRLLLSIIKLQNLKAIHNNGGCKPTEYNVVINHKTTKFESNSQRSKSSIFLAVSCYQLQNYKI